MFPSGHVLGRLLGGAESRQDEGAPAGPGLGAAPARLTFGPGGAGPGGRGSGTWGLLRRRNPRPGLPFLAELGKKGRGFLE